MKQKIKNIWYLFYILAVFVVAIFSYMVYDTYIGVYDEEKILTRSYTKLLKHNIEGSLKQQEVLLDILAEELVSFGRYQNKETARIFLQVALKNSQNIIGFGLVDPKGNLLATSANIDFNNYPNIITNDAVRESFEKTLRSDAMVVGRTYFFEPLQKWLIPIRKAVRDSQGNVIAVMTAGVINEVDHNIIGTLPLKGERHVILVKDDQDSGKLYRLFHEKAHDYDVAKQLYFESVPQEIQDKIFDTLLTQRAIKDKTDAHNGKIYFLRAKNIFKQDVYSAIVYLPRYKLWVVVTQNVDVVMRKSFEKIAFLLVILVIVLYILYKLFLLLETKEYEKHKELLAKINTDELTGLYSRGYLTSGAEFFRDNIAQYWIVFLDLDNFKSVNDRFGHNVGDEILRQSAKRLRNFFSRQDILVRHGADEFIIITPQPFDLQKLQETLVEPYRYNELEFRLGVSFGISKYPDDSRELEELLSMADIAMHEAKHLKNSYKFFDVSMLDTLNEKTLIEQHLREALGTDEIFMMYQPQITQDGKLHGVEALVRWNSKALGNVTPDRFIPVAEESGLIITLGKQIMQQAVKDILGVFQQTQTRFHLSINLSVVQLVDEEFLSHFIHLVEKSAIDKNYLTLEITESLAIEEFDYVIPLLEQIKMYGIGISLDDFGTGYSSLSTLNRLPITELKIDKQFVDDLHIKEDNDMVHAILSIGKSFSLLTVCEGTETKEQVEILKDLGCDIFQGYYFSKPLLKEDLIEFVRSYDA